MSICLLDTSRYSICMYVHTCTARLYLHMTYACVIFSSTSLIERFLKKNLFRSGLDPRYKRMHDQITDQLPQITLNGSPSQRQRCPELLQGIPGANLQFRSLTIFDNLRLTSQIIEYLNYVDFCWISHWSNLLNGTIWCNLVHRHLDLGAEDRPVPNRWDMLDRGLPAPKHGSGGLATWICPLHVLKVRAFWWLGLSHTQPIQ